MGGGQLNETEMAVLACIMNNPTLMYQAKGSLNLAHFGTVANRFIYTAMSDLLVDGQGIDLISVRDKLNSMGKLEVSGGVAYLARLDNELPSSAHFMTYVDAVRAGGVRRAITDAGKAIARIPPVGQTPEELLSSMHSELRVVHELAEGHLRVTTGERAVNELVEMMEDGMDPGIPTGFHGLDQKLSGLRPGNVVLVAGRPAMGKTSLIMDMADHQLRLEEPVVPCIFSLEMSAQELAMVMLSKESGIPRQKLKAGALSKDEWRAIARARSQLAGRPLIIEDSGGLSIDQLGAKARELKNTRAIDIIYIDYIQLMSGTSRSDSRTEQVSEISRGLKLLAKDLEIPIVALSQLSRKNEERADRRPQLSDLRDSGSLEQDADAVIFVYRSGYYKAVDTTHGMTELNVAKNRSGPPGPVHAVWNAEMTSFSNPT